MTPPDTALSAEVIAAFDTLYRERREHERRAFKRRLLRVASALAAVVVIGGGLLWGRAALAQASCTQTLASLGLVSFCPDSPALAAQMNTNTQTLVNLVQQKLGTLGTNANIVTTGDVSSATANIGQVNVNRVVGTNTAGNFHLDTIGNAMYLNWFNGPNGVVFGNGAQAQVGRLDGAGNFTASGSITSGNGVQGAGKLCITTYDCANTAGFNCGGGTICPGGKVMMGFTDGTSCAVQDSAYCCRLALSTNCP